MSYAQITPEERYTLALLRKQVPRPSDAEIARIMGRHRSTIGREVERNSTTHDGRYRAEKAQEKANGRRSRSRRRCQFTTEDWSLINSRLQEFHSPKQISGRLRRDELLDISHESIYLHVWRDKQQGGELYRCLRQSRKKARKRYGTYEKRGRVDNKRHITERPAIVETRTEPGHWEIDTVMGSIGDTHCIVTLVERATGLTLIGKLANRTAGELNRRVIRLIKRHPDLFKTITSDNGTEFHSYAEIERVTGVTIYFAAPYHSWERGTNENTNGLIRQYLPKRISMKTLSQAGCNAVATKLNNRPRERYDFLTPLERLEELLSTAPLGKNAEAPPEGRHPLLDPPPRGGGGKTTAPKKGYYKRRALSKLKSVKKNKVRSTHVGVALRP